MIENAPLVRAFCASRCNFNQAASSSLSPRSIAVRTDAKRFPSSRKTRGADSALARLACCPCDGIAQVLRQANTDNVAKIAGALGFVFIEERKENFLPNRSSKLYIVARPQALPVTSNGFY